MTRLNTNHYFDAKEFAAQAAKPLALTAVQSGAQASVILPPLITDGQRERLGQAFQRTQRLLKNGGAGMRS